MYDLLSYFSFLKTISLANNIKKNGNITIAKGPSLSLTRDKNDNIFKKTMSTDQYEQFISKSESSKNMSPKGMAMIREGDDRHASILRVSLY